MYRSIEEGGGNRMHVPDRINDFSNGSQAHASSGFKLFTTLIIVWGETVLRLSNKLFTFSKIRQIVFSAYVEHERVFKDLGATGLEHLPMPKMFWRLNRRQFYSHAYVNTGRLERAEPNLMHFKWEVIRTHGNQPNTFQMGRRLACE